MLLYNNLSLTAGATKQICSVAHMGFAGTTAVAQHLPAPGPTTRSFGPTKLMSPNETQQQFIMSELGHSRKLILLMEMPKCKLMLKQSLVSCVKLI